jgi:hypothetical protein
MNFDWLKNTRAERDAYRNGVSLFLGALLGANLGTLNGLALVDYATFMAALAAAVMALQGVGRARSRRYALVMIGMLLAILGLVYREISVARLGLPQADIDRLFITIAVWFAAALVIEMTPVVRADLPPARSV